eukprot:4982370-Pleurochrysis_carterae.AAC.1
MRVQTGDAVKDKPRSSVRSCALSSRRHTSAVLSCDAPVTTCLLSGVRHAHRVHSLAVCLERAHLCAPARGPHVRTVSPAKRNAAHMPSSTYCKSHRAADSSTAQQNGSNKIRCDSTRRTDRVGGTKRRGEDKKLGGYEKSLKNRVIMTRRRLGKDVRRNHFKQQRNLLKRTETC